MNAIRQHANALIGTAISTAGASASWAEHLDRALSITASTVAITVGVLTIRSILRSPRQ